MKKEGNKYNMTLGVFYYANVLAYNYISTTYFFLSA